MGIHKGAVSLPILYGESDPKTILRVLWSKHNALLLHDSECDAGQTVYVAFLCMPTYMV